MRRTLDVNINSIMLRKPFIQTLIELAEKDSSVTLVVGDVGYSVVEPFAERFPDQYINAGIAEQNMVTMAAGMAHAGLKPYVYSMQNFLLLRAHEQLRNDVAFADANVKVFGVRGGASYKHLGITHNMWEGEANSVLDILEKNTSLKVYNSISQTDFNKSLLKEYHRSGPAYFAI
jgi:transketolase C-terminal domain/subunit